VRSYGAELAQCGIGAMWNWQNVRSFIPPIPPFSIAQISADACICACTLIKANLIGLIEKTPTSA